VNDLKGGDQKEREHCEGGAHSNRQHHGQQTDTDVHQILDRTVPRLYALQLRELQTSAPTPGVPYMSEKIANTAA
jgi:hypothetical protein